MTDPRKTGSRFDLDAAFAALERDERAGRPAPSAGLVTRVLVDAAGVAAETRPAAVAPRSPRRASGGGGWLRLFGFGDAWAGAMAAAVLLVLVLGFAAGYQAGPGMFDFAGLGGPDLVLADAGDDLFGPEESL